MGMCSTFDSVEAVSPESGAGLAADDLIQGSAAGFHVFDARVAALLLGLEVDVAALKMSFGAGDLRADFLEQRIREVTANYNQLLHSMKIQ